MGKSIINTIRDKASAEQNEELRKDFENEMPIFPAPKTAIFIFLSLKSESKV